MSIEEFVERARLYEERRFLARQVADNEKRIAELDAQIREKDALIAEQNKKLAQLEAELERQQTIERIKQQVYSRWLEDRNSSTPKQD